MPRGAPGRQGGVPRRGPRHRAPGPPRLRRERQGRHHRYVEVKAPGRGIDPAGFTGHDKRQWERQRDLPNLVYTNGTQWRLPAQADLLSRLLGGPLQTMDELRAAGVRWPTTPADRKPRYAVPMVPGLTQASLDL